MTYVLMIIMFLLGLATGKTMWGSKKVDDL